jgi:hypothetical protein
MAALILLMFSAALRLSAGAVTYSENESSARMENGFVALRFMKDTATVHIAADFLGAGAYVDVFSKPFGLEVLLPSSAAPRTCGSAAPAVTHSVSANQDEVTIQADGITDCETNPLVSESWTMTMRANRRDISFSIRGRALVAAQVRAVLHGAYFRSPSIYGLFDDRGVAQMMNKTAACLGSNQTMSRLYALGGGVSVDYIRGDATRSQPVVLLSRGDSFGSGVQDIVLGSYPDVGLSYASSWGRCWAGDASAAVVDLQGSESWAYSASFVPNNYDFPAYSLSDVSRQPDMPFQDLRTYMTGVYGSPAGCLQGYYEGHNGTIAPTISHPDVGYEPDTNFFDPDNFISLSALMYSGDSFFLNEVRRVLERTGETMCGIGSDQLAAYCSAPRERKMHRNSASSLRFGQLGASSESEAAAAAGRTGQLMHHFVNLVPTYESIAGSEQLGPNVFWTWSVMRYIALTQDYAWAGRMFPYVDLSVRYLLTFFDERRGLVSAPGPLWIDVLVRENFTSDSNAAMVPFLLTAETYYETVCVMQASAASSSSSSSEQQQAAASADNCRAFAKQLRLVAERIAVTMSSELWDEASDDHFITQLDPNGGTRDFVDYDSNLLAVAFGAVLLGTNSSGGGGGAQAGLERSKKILARVDSGEFAHVRATWCSEKPYTGDACDCYIVGGSVCGDSVVTLARIGWADAHARRVVNDPATFDSLLLAPLQEDLAQDVWLYERYDSTGEQIRTSFYFEYPSLVTMMLREVRYGLEVGIDAVTVSPFRGSAPERFSLAFGETFFSYSENKVVLALPAPAADAARQELPPKTVTVVGMAPGSDFMVTSECAAAPKRVAADEFGRVVFAAQFLGSACPVTVEKVGESQQ